MVSYNTRALTLECLRSVYRECRGIDFDVIVVDNASGDGSAEAIALEFPQARLIAPGKNLGFAAANNLAAAYATGEYILLLNPDTVVSEGALEELVRFAKARPECKIWGGRTLYGNGRLNPGSCWRGMTLWGLFARALGLSALWPDSPVFNFDSYGGWQRDTVREVDTVTGCFFLIKRTFWEELGGFDTTFYMYGEEADLCLRAKKRGARPIITPAAEIIHYGGMSEKVHAAKMERLLRAKVTLAHKHWGAMRLWLAKAVLRLTVLIRALGYGAAAIFARQSGIGEQARSWREVWDHRKEWLAPLPASQTRESVGRGQGPP